MYLYGNYKPFSSLYMYMTIKKKSTPQGIGFQIGNLVYFQ